jgi:hypothetical protein
VGILIDALEHLAIGEHVIVLVLPLAGGARELGAFEGEAGHLGGPCVISFTSRSSAPGDEPHAENDFDSNEEQRMPTNHTELTLKQLDTVTGGMNAVGGAIAGAAKGVGVHDDGVLPTLPPDWTETVGNILIGPWWAS